VISTVNYETAAPYQMSSPAQNICKTLPMTCQEITKSHLVWIALQIRGGVSVKYFHSDEYLTRIGPATAQPITSNAPLLWKPSSTLSYSHTWSARDDGAAFTTLPGRGLTRPLPPLRARRPERGTVLPVCHSSISSSSR
jgi:hypothetical protein